MVLIMCFGPHELNEANEVHIKNGNNLRDCRAPPTGNIAHITCWDNDIGVHLQAHLRVVPRSRGRQKLIWP